MNNKLPLCPDEGCNRVANHSGEHTDDVDYRQVKAHPFWEVAENFEEQVRKGAFCFQQWTCHNCGAKNNMEEANTFCYVGACDNCGADTDMRITGCNFMLIASMAPREEVRALISKLGLKPPKDN